MLAVDQFIGFSVCGADIDGPLIFLRSCLPPESLLALKLLRKESRHENIAICFIACLVGNFKLKAPHVTTR